LPPCHRQNPLSLRRLVLFAQGGHETRTRSI
jgi:hypothetical protein